MAERILHSEGKLTKRQEIENWLYANYDVRYNHVKYTAEFKPIKAKTGWQELTDRDMNTMLRQLDKKTGLNVNINTLISIVTSDFSRSYNPVIEYFANLPKPDENRIPTYMDELAGCITMKNKKYQETWHLIFRNWLVSCVANSLTPVGCQNQTCLVLTGGQGAGKSTFLNYLTPPVLNEYSYASTLDLKSKDTWIMLGQNFIINIDDQLENLFKQDSETMKTLITSKENKRRLPHGKFVTNIPRIANFCGSVNHAEFLRDQSGNRRFLPFEVKTIDHDFNKISMDLVWAEAHDLYRSDYKYWISAEELNKLFDGFEDFYVITPEEELLLTYFELRNEDEKQEGLFEKLTATEIETELSNLTGNRRLSARTVGQILKKRGCKMESRSGGARCYLVRKKDSYEIDRERGKLQDIILPPPSTK